MTIRCIGVAWAGTTRVAGRGGRVFGRVEIGWKRKTTCCKLCKRDCKREGLVVGGVVRGTASASASASGWRSDPGPRHQPTGSPPRRGPTTLGSHFLTVFQGPAFYALSLIMPLTALAAALGSCGPVLVVGSLPGGTTVNIFVSLASAWYAFLVMPFLDLLLGEEPQEEFLISFTSPTTTTTTTSSSSSHVDRVILYTYSLLHCTVLGWACVLACRAAWAPFFGVALSCGISNGILFTVAHELLHGRRRLDRALASVLLGFVCYGHWAQSHLLHHVKVATPDDPSSARKGETLWEFIPRSVLGNIVDGYSFESRRRKRKGIRFWDVRNRALGWLGGPLVLAILTFIICGPKGILFFLIQAAVGIVMLEAVNYIEHYGLQRGQVADHQYEKVGPQHSWNTNTMYTNACSFRLQRHSHHHANESTPYFLLRSHPDAPRLPAPYSIMVMLALFPPVFFHVMDPLLEKYV